MSEAKELAKGFEEATIAIKAIQAKNDEMGSKLDAIDTEMISKASETAADALQKINDITAKQATDAEEQTKRMEDLEKSFSFGGGSDESNKQAEFLISESVAAFMRKGTTMDDEVCKLIVDGMVKDSLFGASEADKAAIENELHKDLTAGSDPNGGFFVSATRSARMSKRIFETSPIRQLASIETTSGDVHEVVLDDSEADCDWVGEISTRGTTTTPDIALIKIPVHELFAKPRASQKIIDDAGFDIAGWLEDKVSMRFGRKENTAFVNGDGASKPRGFLTYPDRAVASTYERNTIEQIGGSGTAGAITDGDFFKNIQGSLIEGYQGNATWGMKRSTFTDVTKLKDSGGEYIFQTRFLEDRDNRVLLGRPVSFMEDMPVVANDSLSVVYGDFGMGYLIVDRFGIRVLRDPFSAKPFIEFYTTKRVGGDVVNFEALKIGKVDS